MIVRPCSPRLWLVTVALAAVGVAGCGSDSSKAKDGAGTAGGGQMGAMPGMSATPGARASMQMHSLGSELQQGMKIELASGAPQSFTVFEGTTTKEFVATAKDSMHLMAVLSDAETHERIPYANCWATVKDHTGKVVFDERLWPMISRTMGSHYGANVALPAAGHYTVALRVGPPQAARHPEYAKFWLVPHTMTVPLHWTGR